MNKSFIVNGVLLGDEGKGTICDYLTNKNNIKENVRYNGGSQAGHTVIVGGITHRFSQLGSASLNPDTRTFLSDNTVVNLFNLIIEAQVLSSVTHDKAEDILSRIYIDQNSSIVTPYHALINKLRELGNPNRTGTVGTGVSEVGKIRDKLGIDVKVADLLNGEYEKKLLDLFDYTSSYIKERIPLIDPELFQEKISEKDVYYLTYKVNREYMINRYKDLINSNSFNILNGINEFHKGGNILFEGSQGLLLDKTYGIKPNTTSLDTTNHYGIKLASDLNSEVNSIGCIGALISRHGIGVLPTFDKELQVIHDEHQNENYFQGDFRYGWFDAILTRYSLKYNPNSELCMSALDRLNGFETIKICNTYLYDGPVDEDFENTFDYYIDGKDVIICDIKQKNDRLKEYLLRCIPRYIELKGFNMDISNINNYQDLPDELQEYVSLIEMLVNGNITLVGVGPDRSQKLERKKS